MAGLALALVLAPAVAAAQQKSPDDYYKEGETQYNLGNFDKAIEAFKKGFEAEPVNSKKSAYLYNIAESYRQAKDCTNAQFFYKRFLALRDADPSKPLAAKTRKDVEDRIRDLEQCARDQEAIKNRPPDKIVRPDGPDGQEGKVTPPKPPETAIKPKPEDTTPEDDEETSVTATAPTTAPRLISARLVGGGAVINTGDLDVPVQATGALIAGYPIVLDKLTIEAGAAFSFTPVPFEDAMSRSKSALMLGLVANAGVTYEVIPKLGIRGDVGVGVMLFSGASESPFTNNRPIQGGALGMFHLRVGPSGEYAITPNVLATAGVAFSFSPAKKSAFRDDIKSITALDFMVGLGYRM